jgi:2-polyprenyl-3-methyl-5-hydroxy-6-metoxy-1,4-benzoquinol methylase
MPCPVCRAQNWKLVFEVKDFSITQQLFSLAECENCSLRFTVGAPDKESIGPYYKSEKYISHTNSNKGVINQLYQWVRKYMFSKKRKLIEDITGKKVGALLDYGSGTGAFVRHMNQAGWITTGIEPDADARQVAAVQFEINLLDLGALQNLQPAQFDVITLWHVLEHIHDLQLTLQKLKELLKPEGVLIIAVPNYTSLDAYHYGPYWAAYDVPRHLYHFSPFSMEQLMKNNGLRVIAKKPLWFDSFYVSLLSTRYQFGKINYVDGFWQGLRSARTTMSEVDRSSSLIYVVTQ